MSSLLIRRPQVYSTDDVVKVVKVSRKYRIPITPYSGGTSLEGHFGGVLILCALIWIHSNYFRSSIAMNLEASA